MELRKQKVTVTSVAVATTKVLFDILNCIVDSYVGTGDFSLVLGIVHGCGQAIACVSGLRLIYLCSRCCIFVLFCK